jgi:phosphate starvation-inducible PhoH-like protein
MKQKRRDDSPYVYQGKKFGGSLQFRDKIKWTDKQKKFIDLATDKNTKILFVKGPAGSSKSILSVYTALKLLDEKRISEIMYVRSAVESSESSMGFLPGSADMKMAFYNMPFLDKLNELLISSDVSALQKQGSISCFSPNFARGVSWNAKAIIMDEAQNSTRKEIVTILTRLGQFSRGFILADPLQTDLNGRAGGFEDLYSIFDNEESRMQGIHVFEFDENDIMRSELVKFIVRKLTHHT